MSLLVMLVHYNFEDMAKRPTSRLRLYDSPKGQNALTRKIILVAARSEYRGLARPLELEELVVSLIRPKLGIESG
jgi:hypothetical protein